MSLVAQLNSEQPVPLNCTISQSSAHSGRYVPENILVDRPTDQSSRWSGAFQGSAKQWIVLKLETLSVLKSITFGKFYKPHPCNLKEFKIFVGMTPEHMTEVLHGSLKNDSTYEHYPVKYSNRSGVCIPARYVKLVPISAHGQSFHISIWHVSLFGVSNSPLVEQVRTEYDEYRETAVMRHILKHLRQRRLLTPFESILSRSQIELEHPLVTQLHESVVLQGDWKRAEDLIPTLSEAGLFDSYLRGSQPFANWRQLHGTDADGDVPAPRGGHAMCIDPVNEMIYVFGGWDGKKSLDDFWVYSIKEDKWQVLSHSTSADQNAPGARSCHKMVFDTKTGSIYVLGRLSDADTAKPSTNPRSPTRSSSDPRNNPSSPTTTFCSEFYRYHTRGIDKGKWDFLSFDTATSGGPPLIFDHQMVIDSDAQIIYVFGGRVVDGDWNSLKYSGLYSYSIRLSKWKSLQSPETAQSKTIIPPRSGHSMILDSKNRTLYIFAGSCDDRYLCDMYTYDITTNTATEVTSNFELSGGPDGSFAQRAVIDPQLQEIYVFCGLRRSGATGSTTTLSSDSPSWLYNYSKPPGSWNKIISYPPASRYKSPTDYEDDQFEPLPRYAHQVVYNPKTKSIFLHGGNAGPLGQLERGGMDDDGGDQGGEEGLKEHRLDDLWQMTLTRAGSGDVVRKAKFKIRQQQFREMCEEASAIEALDFLQNDVSTVVDHDDPFETELFRSLLTHLLTPSSPSSPTSSLPGLGDSDANLDSLSPVSERWTDQLPIDDAQSDVGHGSRYGGVRVEALKASEDPSESRVRRRGEFPLTAARFSQRNEVFESLLEFVSDREKQPEGSLLDIIEGDDMAP